MFFSRKPAPLKDISQEKAAQLLLTPTALADLTETDARSIAGFMLFRRVRAGDVFIREGEVAETDFMMLVLDGDVAVESEVSATSEGMMVSIMGPGSLIGEMGILDGEPRSATCTANTELAVAVLPREAISQLIASKPAVAARLMLAISKRLSDRLRQANRKIRTLDGLSRALQQELDAAHKPPALRKPSTVRVPDLEL